MDAVITPAAGPCHLHMPSESVHLRVARVGLQPTVPVPATAPFSLLRIRHFGSRRRRYDNDGAHMVGSSFRLLLRRTLVFR